MKDDTIKDIIDDARGLALDATTKDTALLRYGLERIAARLEELVRGGMYITPKAAQDAVVGAPQIGGVKVPGAGGEKPWKPLEIPECGIDFKRYYSKDCEVYICAWKDGQENISHVYEVRCRKVEDGKWEAEGSNDGRKLFTLSVPSRQLSYRFALGAMRDYLRRGHRKSIKRAKKTASALAGARSDAATPPAPSTKHPAPSTPEEELADTVKRMKEETGNG